MTYIEQGTTGAFRATWRKDNPRSLLETIIAKNPQAKEEKIHDLFWLEIEDDKLLLRACIEYWLDNNCRSLLAERNQPSRSHVSKRIAVEAAQTVKKNIKARIVDEARTMLLNLTMPNDKRLGDCTGAECLTFGSWMSLLAKEVPPTKIVSAVLSEKQVWKFWQIARK